MSSTKKSFSLISYLRSIKIPVFKFILYSGLGYMGYIFYQDYKYKQLLAEIHQTSSASKSTSSAIQTPLLKISKIIKKIQTSQSKYQLKFLYKDLQLNIQKYWIDPYKKKNLIDMKINQIVKPQNQKKIWWLKHYVEKYKFWTNYYQRTIQQKEGTFGLFFWLDITRKINYQVLECNKVQNLINEALRLRQDKCLNFSLEQVNVQGGHYSTRNDQYMLECLQQTEKCSVALEKMRQRLRIIEKYQYK